MTSNRMYAHATKEQIKHIHLHIVASIKVLNTESIWHYYTSLEDHKP